MCVCLCICLCVCLYRRISPTTEPIGFSFTGQLFIGPRKVYNYFGGGYNHPPKRNRPQKRITYPPPPPPKKKKTKLKKQVLELNSPFLKCPQRPLGGVAAILLYKVISVFCLYQRILLTAELILFSFTVKLLIGPGKVLNYFWGGCLHPLPPKNIFKKFLKLNFKWDEIDVPPTS